MQVIEYIDIQNPGSENCDLRAVFTLYQAKKVKRNFPPIEFSGKSQLVPESLKLCLAFVYFITKAYLGLHQNPSLDLHAPRLLSLAKLARLGSGGIFWNGKVSQS